MGAWSLDAGEYQQSIGMYINHDLLISDEFAATEAKARNTRPVDKNRNNGRPMRVVVKEVTKLHCSYLLLESRTDHNNLLDIIRREEGKSQFNWLAKHVGEKNGPFFEQNHGRYANHWKRKHA